MPDYRVTRDGLLLGTLTRTGGDMPWWEGVFEPAPGFEAVRPLFDRERALLDADRLEEWEAAWDELAAGLALEPLDGREPLTEFLLHIAGRQASWRY